MITIKDHVLLPILASIGANDFIKIAKKTYEKMGITVLKNYDGNLLWAKLPDGWDIIECGELHDLLYDNNHTVRGEIEYEINEEGEIKHAMFYEVK